MLGLQSDGGGRRFVLRLPRPGGTLVFTCAMAEERLSEYVDELTWYDGGGRP
ncbi:MAG: hypothetical protein AB7Y46_17875 [Armatimonadota bacterium]